MTETTEQYRQRVIRVSEERGEFVTDADGYVYWWPEESPNGHLASHHLRWLADELDRRNREWDRQIARDLDRMARRRLMDKFVDLCLCNVWLWLIAFWVLAFAIAYWFK